MLWEPADLIGTIYSKWFFSALSEHLSIEENDVSSLAFSLLYTENCGSFSSPTAKYAPLFPLFDIRLCTAFMLFTWCDFPQWYAVTKDLTPLLLVYQSQIKDLSKMYFYSNIS